MLITKTFKCSLLIHVYGGRQYASIVDSHVPGIEVEITNRMSSLVINRLLRAAGHIVPPKTSWHLNEEAHCFLGDNPTTFDGYGLLQYDPKETTLLLSKARIRAMVRKQLRMLMTYDAIAIEMAKWVCDDDVRNGDGSFPTIKWRK